jgi:hypothetical protein
MPLRSLPFVAVIVLILVAIADPSHAQPRAEAKEAQVASLRILFIGNGVTYKDGMPATLAEMAATASDPRSITSRVVGFDAATLKSHWEKGDALKVLLEAAWDIVVLQEHSHIAADQPEQMYRYTRLFDAEIRKVGARTFIFQAWAWNYRFGTIVQIEAASTQISRELGAQLVPVGSAWKIVMKDFPRMALLDHSVVPTPAAVYLSAAVFHSVIFKRKPDRPRELSVGLNGIDAASLRSVAWEVAQSVK